jgi:hypothetical protein
MEDVWKPLKDVRFGRFDPDDLVSDARRTTHAFHRSDRGQWRVKKLSQPGSQWEYVGGSSFPLSALTFGDFTGDGVTDVLAVVSGRWAISESARQPWRPLNRFLGDAVTGLLIANMDPDDKFDDALRLEVRLNPIGAGAVDIERIWWRSRNGVEEWKEFKRYAPARYHPGFLNEGLVYPGLGFVGRFGAVSGGTLVIDATRFGHFFSPANASTGDTQWASLFPY